LPLTITLWTEETHRLTKDFDLLGRDLLLSRFYTETLGYYRNDGAPTPVIVEESVKTVLAVYEGKLTSAGIVSDCRFEDHPPLLGSRTELM